MKTIIEILLPRPMPSMCWMDIQVNEDSKMLGINNLSGDLYLTYTFDYTEALKIRTIMVMQSNQEIPENSHYIGTERMMDTMDQSPYLVHAWYIEEDD